VLVAAQPKFTDPTARPKAPERLQAVVGSVDPGISHRYMTTKLSLPIPMRKISAALQKSDRNPLFSTAPSQPNIEIERLKDRAGLGICENFLEALIFSERIPLPTQPQIPKAE
jgi:hypothetical protein